MARDRRAALSSLLPAPVVTPSGTRDNFKKSGTVPEIPEPMRYIHVMYCLQCFMPHNVLIHVHNETLSRAVYNCLHVLLTLDIYRIKKHCSCPRNICRRFAALKRILAAATIRGDTKHKYTKMAN